MCRHRVAQDSRWRHGCHRIGPDASSLWATVRWVTTTVYNLARSNLTVGGLNGCIGYEDLAYTAAQGFASVGTNNGHVGTSGEPFLNNTDVVEDFAYRA